jgi:hypothetical protein
VVLKRKEGVRGVAFYRNYDGVVLSATVARLDIPQIEHSRPRESFTLSHNRCSIGKALRPRPFGL